MAVEILVQGLEDILIVLTGKNRDVTMTFFAIQQMKDPQID